MQTVTKNLNERIAGTVIFVLLSILAVVILMPFLFMISTSLKPNDEVYEFPIRWVPRTIVFSNYTQLFSMYPFFRYIANSLLVAVCVTVLHLLVASMAAYSFSRIEFKGRDPLFFLFLATMMIPFHMKLIPMFVIVKTLGWLDNYLALIVPALFAPFGTFLLRQYFLTIPMDLDEAAEIDGCSPVRIYWQVCLPLGAPALSTLTILTFLASWNNFLWPLIVLNSNEKYTLPIGLSQMVTEYFFETDWNVVMAAALVSILPVLIVFLFAQKFIVQGIALSGLKG